MTTETKTEIKWECAAPISEDERIPATEEFCTRNKLTLGRSAIEYAEKMNAHKDGFLDFTGEVLGGFMMYAPETKEFFNKEYVKAIESGEKQHTVVTDIVEAAQEFLDYMVFAWGKARDERGISAGRSIQKLSAWLWVMGRTDLSDKIETDSLYAPYGAPALVAICDDMGVPTPSWIREFAGV